MIAFKSETHEEQEYRDNNQVRKHIVYGSCRSTMRGMIYLRYTYAEWSESTTHLKFMPLICSNPSKNYEKALIIGIFPGYWAVLPKISCLQLFTLRHGTTALNTSTITKDA